MVAVTANLAPTITLTAGDTSQIVWPGTTIEPIVYTVSNATGIILGGSLPTGVDGEYSNPTYTIQGTVSSQGVGSQGMFNYTLTTTNSNGCPDTTVAGTIWAIGRRQPPPAPPNAASNAIWLYDNGFWSDAIRMPDCDKTDFNFSYTTPDCRSYTSSSGRTWYYYNQEYVNQYASTLCPSPWHVPTLEEAKKYNDPPGHSCWGSDCDYRYYDMYGGYFYQNGLPPVTDVEADFWSTTDEGPYWGWMWNVPYANSSFEVGWFYIERTTGAQVQCVLSL